MATITLTDEQLNDVIDILEDTVSDWEETRSELAHDEGEDSDEVEEQDQSIVDLTAILTILRAARK